MVRSSPALNDRTGAGVIIGKKDVDVPSTMMKGVAPTLTEANDTVLPEIVMAVPPGASVCDPMTYADEVAVTADPPIVMTAGGVAISVCDGMTRADEPPIVKVCPPMGTTIGPLDPDEETGLGSGVAVTGEEKTEKDVDSVFGSGVCGADSGDDSDSDSGDDFEDESGAGLLGCVDSGWGAAAFVEVTTGGLGAASVDVGMAAGGELGLAAVVSAAGSPWAVTGLAGGGTVNVGAPGPFATGVMAYGGSLPWKPSASWQCETHASSMLVRSGGGAMMGR